ncbi:hypothetical protein CO058_02920 [candidate division WWE3 bacterium CG_4_9_14_0_2_um_filter_35_11]|uniref:Transcriptional regulator n=1 Tax=candidate division WWE3 bacterium CG_4_9_14_0_2_um_filter_35_11 TaxID=1975077 RepID=A0A2M8ELB6_UNCKA|nr:MAG: hypothetical protein COV25_01850 [candidate division WWE3 bacterium CG10_big_fil_rev_8_21_14_0_10_35_32]PJC23534.1 MAG: hypothetical protein CO058_02920 [candidate division WWE3 bacterium CG_4_9_14_0_2_um_filter_35_11]
MNWNDLQKTAKLTPIFTLNDVLKWFPDEGENQILVQLSRFVKHGLLSQPRKGIYLLTEYKLEDPFLLANLLRNPSYISLETAMNYYGLIPDIPASITSVTTKKTKTYVNTYGKFIYRSVKSELFFGFEQVQSRNNHLFGYKIATPEKTLLDYLHLNPHVDNLDELRLRNTENIDREKLNEFSKNYTERVCKLIEKI